MVEIEFLDKFQVSVKNFVNIMFGYSQMNKITEHVSSARKVMNAGPIALAAINALNSASSIFSLAFNGLA